MSDQSDVALLNITQDLIDSGPYYAGTLSPKSKQLLTLPPSERSETGLKNLVPELRTLHDFFRPFSVGELDHLARHLRLVCEPANSTVLRVGNPDGQALYIVLSGVLEMQYQDQDSSDPWPARLLKRHDCFGLDDLARSRPPLVTVHTVGLAELLQLRKEDSTPVLETMAKCQAEKAFRLRTAPAVARFGWTETDYLAMESYCVLRTLAAGREVYRSRRDGRKSYYAHFVISGECGLCPPRLKHCEVKVLREESFFGVGEELEPYVVVAKTLVEVLMVPRFLLLHRDGGLLRLMAAHLTTTWPIGRETAGESAESAAANPYYEMDRLRDRLRNVALEESETP